MEKIQIKCQFCGQKFAIPSDFMGKTVKCGGCDEMFEVSEASLSKQRKVYPGERTNEPEKTYAKAGSTTPTTNNSSTVNFQTASYQHISSKYAQPRKANQPLMIYTGILMLLTFIAIFLSGGKEGGIMDSLDNSRRLVLTGFVVLVGSLLILIGFRRKPKALLPVLILGGILAAMPFIYPGEITGSEEITMEHTEIHTTSETDTNTGEQDNFVEALEEYKAGIGYDRIDYLRGKESDPNRVKAIILHDCKMQYLDTILIYLDRALSLKDQPTTYPNGREINGKPVTLITLVSDTSLEDLYEMTKKFGEPIEMNPTLSSLKVIEVTVDKTSLAPPKEGVVSNPLDPNYFDANLLELQSIDRSRQIEAAKRLESGDHIGRQADIAETLANQITITDHELSAQFITTLLNWTKPEFKTHQKVLDYAQKIAGSTDMSQSVMNYLVKKGIPGSASILAKQWATKQGPLLWQNHIIQAKSYGEEAIIKALPHVPQSHYKSAAAILTKIGTSRSLPAINNAISKANKEDRKYLKAVIDEIKSRQ